MVEEQELQLVIGQLVVVFVAQEVIVTLVVVLVELTIKENPEAHVVQLKLPEASIVPEEQFLVALGTATQAAELFK